MLTCEKLGGSTLAKGLEKDAWPNQHRHCDPDKDKTTAVICCGGRGSAGSLARKGSQGRGSGLFSAGSFSARIGDQPDFLQKLLELAEQALTRPLPLPRRDRAAE